MLLIGLTGSIGMGKSLTLAALRRLLRGAAFYDADAAVHQLYRMPAVVNDIRRHFPTVYKAGVINRKALSDIVFADADAQNLLRRILYPRLALLEKQAVLAAARHGMRLMILDIPLLFETHADRRLDAVAVVSAPPFVQRARVLARPGMNDARFRQVTNAQMADGDKRKLADFIVPTGLGRANTTRCLQKLLRMVKVQSKARRKWRAFHYMKEFYARNRT